MTSGEQGCCGGSQGSKTSTPALEILAERFARGEIDKAEFEERRQVIAGAWEAAKSAAGNKKGCC
jgi:predicted Zn-dependent peptidase